MPSKNMIKKGKRRQTVKPAYRAHRDAQTALEEATAIAADQELFGPEPRVGRPSVPTPPSLEQTPPAQQTTLPNEAPPLTDGTDELETEDEPRDFLAGAEAHGKRLDSYLARMLPDITRARVQLLIEAGQVHVDGSPEKASLKLRGGERIQIHGDPRPEPLRAEPEDIPLTIVYEDADLAVIDKPAGMTVHAGAGDAEHNRGTLVNALLFHFGASLADSNNALRPGIVHRLDKDTSGLILVAKNDSTHSKLSAMFAERSLRKEYVALVHGLLAADEGTVDLPIGRDPVRRTRMTARRSVESGARPAVTHWRVLERFGSKDRFGTKDRFGSKERSGPLGNFTLVEVHIETGRTHQIRVHLAALGHPVVGDTLYGAPGTLRAMSTPSTATQRTDKPAGEPTLQRNFLHAAALAFKHPRSGEALAFTAPLPPELQSFLEQVRSQE